MVRMVYRKSGKICSLTVDRTTYNQRVARPDIRSFQKNGLLMFSEKVECQYFRDDPMSYGDTTDRFKLIFSHMM